MYDVIIAGGGPAGSTAAYFLGEAGQRVLLLEKARLPRYKTCGGGIPARLLDQFPFSFDPVIESRVETVTYALHEKAVTIPLPPNTIQMVMRQDFDAHILRHARAEVCQGATVKSVREAEDRVIVEMREGERYEGRYLIGADGASSVVAREVGLRRTKVLTAALEVEATPPPEVFARFDRAPVFIFDEIQDGYLWIFPKAQHLSVGIAALRPRPGELQAVLSQVMTRYGISLEGAAIHGHPIPQYARREPIATQRVLLVGDAAGLVDPFNGEGIRFAIKSGRLAAEAILSGRPESYPALVFRKIGFSHTIGVALARLFYRFPRLCFALGVRNPAVTALFVELLSDRAGYPEVIARMAAGLPAFAVKEIVRRLFSGGRVVRGFPGNKQLRESKN